MAESGDGSSLVDLHNLDGHTDKILTWEEQPVGLAQGHSHAATQHMRNSSKSSVDKNHHSE